MGKECLRKKEGNEGNKSEEGKGRGRKRKGVERSKKVREGSELEEGGSKRELERDVMYELTRK